MNLLGKSLLKEMYPFSVGDSIICVGSVQIRNLIYVKSIIMENYDYREDEEVEDLGMYSTGSTTNLELSMSIFAPICDRFEEITSLNERELTGMVRK